MGLLEQQLSNGLLNQDPLRAQTSNRNMLAQALKSRQTTPRNQLTGQGLLDTAAIGLSPIPVIGDLLGLGADANRYINDPSSRTPLNFGLTALGALPFVPPAAAIFAGPLAKTAKLDQKTLAEGMEKAGRSRDDIWKETGWFKGPEGKWKFEIDDSGAKFGTVPTWGVLADKPKVGDVFNHAGLYSAYPNTKNFTLSPVGATDRVSGRFLGDGIELNGTPSRAQSSSKKQFDTGLADKTSTTLHELQHGVQQSEGFARGGNPETMALEWGMAKDKMNFDTTVAALVREAEASTNGYVDEAAKLLNEVGIEVSRAHIDRAMSIGTKQALKAAEESTNALKKYGDLGIRGSGDPGNKLYHRLAGEAEARAVQSRMNMNQQQRQATPPWQSYDVPWEQLIIK